MKRPAAALMTVRLIEAAFLFTTAVYCLLAYLPFTYQQIHQGNLFPALSAFARWQPAAWWPVMLLTAWSLHKEGSHAGPVLAFAGVQGGLASYLLFRPLVDQLHSPAASLFWCLAAFGSLAWTGALDWKNAGRKFTWPEWSEGSGQRLFCASLASAVVLTVAFAVTAALRTPSGRPGMQAILFGFDAHLLLFMGLFAVLTLSRALSEALPWPAAAEFWTIAAIAALGGRLLLIRVFFPVVSFEGPAAECVAAFAPLALVLFWSGVCARLHAEGSPATASPVRDPLSLIFLPLTFWTRGRGRAESVAALMVAVAAGCAASTAAAGMDWNYLAQKTAAMLVWVAAFAFLYRIAGGAPRERTLVFLLASIAVVGAHRLLAAHPAGFDAGGYANYNPSYKVLFDWMAPAEGTGGYYRFLARNTNLPRDRNLAPVEVNLTQRFQPGAGPRPQIFLFVIDSLRRDYLAPYNPSVSFTPAVAAFARESVVEERAFTRYSGTGLSEPSIWAGAMLPHKQYVTPFHPMNSLEKLLDALGYDRFISFDTILGTLLERPPSATALDEGVQTMDLDFGRTVQELEAKIGNRRASDPPVFAYTQPQNLHVSVINRAGRSVPAGESYPGFEAGYASRVRGVDTAFGNFIGFLKQKGWYENSVVILTADHGDSLGEEGRWGHAYSMVPEVVRIPLIIHVPDDLRKSKAHSSSDPAFLTDIAPTLYELLGQSTAAAGELAGKPLFAADPAALAARRRDYWLLASSYAPVYGILRGGRELYVSDALQYREFRYELGEPASRALTVNPAARRAAQELIRKGIQSIAAYYRTEQGTAAAASGGAR